MNWNELIGRQLGRYLLVEEIGVGGSSRVYRGKDTESEREVAVKVLPNDAEDRVGFVRRFEREVQVVAQLSHPNIVAIYDSGKADDVVYLVMQLVRGGTLRSRLGRPLPVPEATAAIVQMAFALHHAHLRGIIHRDVKASNMLVSADDTRHLLLSDFGIAKLHGMRGLTKSGTTIGTPEYMSPEQAEGKEIDPRADVYSLGCVLYEALSGRPPFIGATPVSVLYQQVHSRPAYLRGLNADVPRELSRLLDQALAKRPEERFGTAERFAEALLPFAEGALPPLPYARETRDTETLQSYGPHTVMPGPAVARVAEPPSPGLGEEGLDALFPDGSLFTGGRRVVHSRPLVGGELIEAAPGWSEETSAGLRPEERRAIPLPSFRLPTKETRKLNLPLTTDGQLDMDALLSSIDGPPTAAQAGRLSAPRLASPSLQSGRPPRPPSEPVWRPPPPETARKVRAATPRSSDRRRLWAGLSVAALLIVSLAAWIAVHASSLGVTVGSHSTPHPVATHTPAPTQRPTSTVPVGTPTPTQQQVLDRQAAASVRSVTVTGNSYDLSCNAAKSVTSTTPGVVYVNVCMGQRPVSDLVNVSFQQHGSVVYGTSDFYIGPGGSHTFGWQLQTGSYSAVITLDVNGKDGAVVNIPFTVR
jgi:serine/threonine protein kinase